MAQTLPGFGLVKHDYTKLALEERSPFFRLHQGDYSQLAIAQALGHHRATVKQARKHNTSPQKAAVSPEAA